MGCRRRGVGMQQENSIQENINALQSELDDIQEEQDYEVEEVQDKYYFKLKNLKYKIEDLQKIKNSLAINRDRVILTDYDADKYKLEACFFPMPEGLNIGDIVKIKDGAATGNRVTEIRMYRLYYMCHLNDIEICEKVEKESTECDIEDLIKKCENVK